MGDIVTVCGTIDSEKLGFTSMHEHVLLDAGAFRGRYEKITGDDASRDTYDSATPNLETAMAHRHNIAYSRNNLVNDDEGLMAAELGDFKDSGGAAIVDMSTIGLRSNIAGIKRISEKSDVHVITSTGFYAEDTWEEKYTGYTVDQFAEVMHGELADGIEETGILPGHIKVAMESPGISAPEENVLRAAARVSKETGFSMTIHRGVLQSEDSGLRIVDILSDECVSPERVLLCHVQEYFFPQDLKTLILDPESWRLNLDYAKHVLDLGMNICIDCFGHRWDMEMIGIVLAEDYHRLAGLVALIHQGYADQIVLGTDVFVKVNTRRYGGEGYARLTNFVAPMLEILGVGSEVIQKVFVDNPARILSKVS